MKTVLIHPGLIGNVQQHITNVRDIAPLETMDLYVHTWNTEENLKNLEELKSTFTDVSQLNIEIEDYNNLYSSILPKFAGKVKITKETSITLIKKFAVFYSMYKAVNAIKDIEQYDIAVKIKADLDLFQISLKNFPAEDYDQFHINRAFNYPFLEKFKPKDCIYAIKFYRSFLERSYYTSPDTLKKLFLKPLDQFIEEVSKCYYDLYVEAGNFLDIEGNLIWQKLCFLNDVPVLHTTDIQVGTPVGDSPVMSLNKNLKIHKV